MHLRKIMTRNPEGELLWAGLQLLKLAPSRRHHFSPTQLALWKARGFCEITDSTITLKTVDGDMIFDIDHEPGRYCLHCNEKLHNEEEDPGAIPQGDPRLGAAARKHVKEKHAGKKAAHSSFPHGYKFKHYYGATARKEVPTINPKAKQIGRIEKVAS